MPGSLVEREPPPERIEIEVVVERDLGRVGSDHVEPAIVVTWDGHVVASDHFPCKLADECARLETQQQGRDLFHHRSQWIAVSLVLRRRRESGELLQPPAREVVEEPPPCLERRRGPGGAG